MFFGVVFVLLTTVDLCFFPVQDFNALVRYLNQFSPDQFLTAMSNFHLLVSSFHFSSFWEFLPHFSLETFIVVFYARA